MDVKTNSNEYARAHWYVRKIRGKASLYICKCDKQAFDWAFKHGADDINDPNNYIAMCRGCHVEYDRPGWQNNPEIGKAISAAKSGIRTVWGSTHGNSKLTEEKVIEIRYLYSTGEFSQRELGLLYMVCEDSIYKIVNRKSWTHV